MNRDLLISPYGRFYNLALYLVQLGHTVHLVLISYKANEWEQVDTDGIKITSLSALPNPLSAFNKAEEIINKTKPDWIFGFSDTYYGILAAYFARKYNCKSLIDAYDNYESYMPLLKPIHWLWRDAISSVTLVTCAGPSLETLFRQHRKEGPIYVLPMTVNHNEFKEESREKCRQKLGLPLDKKLIGYHGSISNSRGIDILFEAVKKIQLTNPDVKLVMTGRTGKYINIPDSVNYLGYLPDVDIPLFVNSMDIVAVINRDTNFGNYSYPIKLYEAQACRIPVVVSRTKSTDWILKDNPELLVRTDDTDDLAKVIIDNLDRSRIDYKKSSSWLELTAQLYNHLN